MHACMHILLLSSRRQGETSILVFLSLNDSKTSNENKLILQSHTHHSKPVLSHLLLYIHKIVAYTHKLMYNIEAIHSKE